MGLEPDELSKRQQFHFLARVFPLIEQNYNFLELGPRGTGKSYVYSEFTPYSTLISGGQTTTATLFYNKQRKEVGIVGFWDTIAFDEVAGIKVKDPGTITILKDYMANGHFNLGAEVIAPASLSFVGNVDDSIEQLVNSEQHDLCRPLPAEFDLAVIHRFHTYLPGWEIPPNSSKLLTNHYGLITDYLAEAFHYMFSSVNLFSVTKSKLKLNGMHEGRDETAVIKTVAAFCKMLHPGSEPDTQELSEYIEYAIEGRRRVKEQLNKRKKDDEFGNINLGYINAAGEETIVHCPESKGIEATQNPRKSKAAEVVTPVESTAVAGSTAASEIPVDAPTSPTEPELESPTPLPSGPKEKETRIFYGDRGFSFKTLFIDYLRGAKTVKVEDPYIRMPHQVSNFLRFCETCVEAGTVEAITLITNYDDEFKKQEVEGNLVSIGESLASHGIKLEFKFDSRIHDRRIELSNDWTITLGRGLDIYQRPDSWMDIGANDLGLRQCQETNIVYTKRK